MKAKRRRNSTQGLYPDGSGILYTMRIQEIIAKKRDGHALTAEEIAFFITGEIPDYQAAALLMAIYLRGMDTAETAALTTAMAHSGRMLDLSAFPGALDKHSTGGVGDKTSLIVVPLLAAVGVPVCKMSGRGLGHTGGTLDKLEAIAGLSVEQTPEQMLAQVRAVGACLVGQTADLAPADKKLYALRDATATVASLPLIVSSILSKKLAGGAPAFLFDVKVGEGALMKTEAEGAALAQALVAGAAASGRRAVALLTDMDQPLGRTIGNALEVAEAIEVLTTPQSADPRLVSLCLALAAEGLALAQELPRPEATALVTEALQSGAARERFAALIAAQGGGMSVVDHPERLPQAPCRWGVVAPTSGYLTGVATQTLGEVVVVLGGGRARKEDRIDPAVGLRIHATVGQWVERGQPLAEVHAASDTAAAGAAERVLAALHLGQTPPQVRPLAMARYPSQP